MQPRSKEEAMGRRIRGAGAFTELAPIPATLWETSRQRQRPTRLREPLLFPRPDSPGQRVNVA